MKVSSAELPPRQLSLDIEVEQERLEQAMDAAYRRLSGRVDVPGFRRGKAPRSMVERMIGRDRIVEEALDHLVPEVVSEAIEQEKVEPYTRPRVESIEFDPLRLKAVVGLAPKVELGDYRDNLRVRSEPGTVGDAQVDAVIQQLRESHAQWAPVERPVQTGDRVGLDLRASVEGLPRPMLDSKDAEYVVDAAGAQPAPGFADQLVGARPGDQKTFTLVMPDDYRDKDIAGKPAEFTVSVHWVKERELPALDEDFVQQVGDYTAVAGLRAAVETQLREREAVRAREQFEEAAVSKLVEISSIEFPPQLVDHQAQHMLDTFTRTVEQRGIQLTQYLRLIGKDQAAFEQEIRAEAETRVRRSLALDAFADAEQIAPDHPEVADGAEVPAQGQDTSRERKAMARLLDLATANGADVPAEKTTPPVETADTDPVERETQAPATPIPEANDEEEERGSA